MARLEIDYNMEKPVNARLMFFSLVASLDSNKILIQPRIV